MPEINIKRLMPVIVVGLLYLAYVANGVNNFISGMWGNSLHNPESYETIGPGVGTAIPDASAVAPKGTYLCNPANKNPWIGCTI